MRFCKIWIFIIFVSILSIVAAYKMYYNAIPREIVIATGNEEGAYYKFATIYKDILKKDNIDLKIIKTAGSIESLKLLNKNRVDIAFVQGGTGANYKDKELKSLASLFYEPLWIFYKKGLDIKYISDFKGKKVSIGEQGSGTKALSEIIFEQNDIHKDELLSLSYNEAYKKLHDGEIDALALVASPEAPMIKKLILDKNIYLMSFERELAYKNRYEYIDSVDLNQGVVDLSRNIPEHNIRLLATTASLVVKDGLNSDLQRLIVKRIKDVHRLGGIFEPKNFFPSIDYVELPISEHSKSYLLNGDSWTEKYLPYWIASLIDNLLFIVLPLIPLLIIFLKTVVPSYSLYMKHKIYLLEEKIGDMERSVDEVEKENIKALKEKSEELKNSIKHDCIIYFFYTRIYYKLILQVNFLRNKLKLKDEENNI